MPWKNNSNNTDMKPIDTQHLQAYLDGELSASEAAAVEQHLADRKSTRLNSSHL